MKLLLPLILLLTGCSSSLSSRVDAIPGWSYSPSGVRLKKEVKVDTAQQLVIEAGLRDAGRRARCAGYTQHLEITDYTVAVLDGEDRNGIAVFRIGCASYCGTEWDQGGFIYIAGQYLQGQDVIAIPNGAKMDAVANEAEHRILFYNDKVKYEATKIHAGGGHPLIPECR